MKTTTRLLLALCASAWVGCLGKATVEEAAGNTGATAQAVSMGFSNEVGRLVSGGNGQRRTFYSYDSRGRALSTQHVLTQANVPITYVFSNTYGFPCSSSQCKSAVAATNGTTLVNQSFPDGETISYSFDLGGAQQSISTRPDGGMSQPIISRVLRNSRGQTTEVDYGDGTATTHRYNDGTDLRLNQLETTLPDGGVLQLYTYAFDNDGNVTAVNDYCNEADAGPCSSSSKNTTYTATYQYDALGELTQATRNGTPYAYGYDSLGNLTNKEGTAQQYFPSGNGKPTPHALCSVGGTSCTTGVTYAYDANGNLTHINTGWSATWNANNMPVSVANGVNGTTTKSFVGEALWKKQFMGTTTYYLPSMRVENGAYRKYYASFAERDTDGSLKFYHSDHLGNSTLVTDVGANVVQRAAYKPFGETIATAGTLTPKYKFNFKEQEADGSGFYDYGARLLNPATGRWLSPDTSTVDGPNRYTYAANNPLYYRDPTGHGDTPWWVQKFGGTLNAIGAFADGDRAALYGLPPAPETRDHPYAFRGGLVLGSMAGVFINSLSFDFTPEHPVVVEQPPAATRVQMLASDGQITPSAETWIAAIKYAQANDVDVIAGHGDPQAGTIGGWSPAQMVPLITGDTDFVACYSSGTPRAVSQYLTGGERLRGFAGEIYINGRTSPAQFGTNGAPARMSTVVAPKTTVDVVAPRPMIETITSNLDGQIEPRL